MLFNSLAWLGLAGLATALPSQTSPNPPAFTYDRNNFLLHGKPYQIRGGQMDFQRIPPEYWSDRLMKAKAMGLNTVFSYVYWNLLEPQPGQWNFQDRNDMARWFRLAQEAGLTAVLRPGSYICGERDWGGMPSWLLQVPGMSVRSNNQPFLDATRNYVERIGNELKNLQVTHGGPLLMVQVENEYGSYGSDHEYTSALADIMRANFDVPLYTNDGYGQSNLEGGSIPGILAEIDGSPQAGFPARDQYVTDPSSLGPLLDGEYYTTWLDVWGVNYTHQTVQGKTANLEGVYKDIEYILSNNASFSLYMFHGGSNFGFENGALWNTDGYLQPVTSSYDYGAPLDESGRTTDQYAGLWNTIGKYVPKGEKLPALPSNTPLQSIPDIRLQPMGSLFDKAVLGNPVRGQSPMTMEALNQPYGFVMYEYQSNGRMQGVVQPGDRPRDRVIVYVNGQRKGVIDSIYIQPNQVTVSLNRGDKLQLLVENLGRVDYGATIPDQHRGILGDVTVGGTKLQGWSMYKLPLDDAPSSGHHRPWNQWWWGGPSRPPTVKTGSPPAFYTGNFRTQCSGGASCDTFLSIPQGTKGQVWVNGFNLGRYWVIGPQQSLYVPGILLKRGWQDNEIVVMELEPKTGVNMVARGLSERVWGNNPDPDRS